MAGMCYMVLVQENKPKEIARILDQRYNLVCEVSKPFVAFYVSAKPTAVIAIVEVATVVRTSSIVTFDPVYLTVF